MTTKTKTLSYPFSLNAQNQIAYFTAELKSRGFYSFVARKNYGFVVRVPAVYVAQIDMIDRLYYTFTEIKLQKHE